MLESVFNKVAGLEIFWKTNFSHSLVREKLVFRKILRLATLSKETLRQLFIFAKNLHHRCLTGPFYASVWYFFLVNKMYLIWLKTNTDKLNIEQLMMKMNCKGVQCNAVLERCCVMNARKNIWNQFASVNVREHPY